VTSSRRTAAEPVAPMGCSLWRNGSCFFGAPSPSAPGPAGSARHPARLANWPAQSVYRPRRPLRTWCNLSG